MKKRIAVCSLLLCVFTLWLVFVIALWNRDISYSLPYTTRVSYITGLSNKNYIISAGLPLLAFALFVSMPEALKKLLPDYRVWNGPYIAAVAVIMAAEILCMLSGAEFFVDRMESIFGWKAAPVLKKLCELYIHSIALGLGISTLSFLLFAGASLHRAGAKGGGEMVLRCGLSGGICLIIALAISVASQMLLNILALWAPSAVSAVGVMNRANAENLSLALVSIISAPITEETAFRGLICRGLDKHGNRWAAIIISALFFGLWHRNLGQFAYTFVWGILYGWLYVNTGSIIWTSFIHFFSNVIAILTVSSHPKHVFGAQPFFCAAKQWLKELPPLASLLVMALCALVIVLCLREMKRQGDAMKKLA